MTILPLRTIIETDQPIFGTNLLNLGKLERNGFPIPPAVAISAPEIVTNTLLKHLETSEKEVFDQRLTIIKNELSKISIPEELASHLSKQKYFNLSGKTYTKINHVWIRLLEMWLDEIKTKIWREGFSGNISLCLTPRVVFFINKIDLVIETHFDPDLGDVVIKSEKKLSPKALQKIDQLVIDANRKLFLPQVYRFVIVNDRVLIVGLSPFTQTLMASKEEDVVIPKNEERRLVKSAVKLFLNLSAGFSVHTNVGGVLIEGENLTDFEQAVFKLSDASLAFPDKPIIFKLPDKKDEETRGTLRLIHDKGLLGRAADVLLFVRNKKNLLNIQIAVPFVRSLEEFLQIKRELAVREITRKGSLKLWMEIGVPENVINIEDYVESGLDGVILDIDQLQKFLGGFGIASESGNFENFVYKKQVAALMKFLKPFLKTLHKTRIPVLVKGELSLYPDILDFFIEEGIYGIVVNNHIDADSLPDHLNWAERRMVAKRFEAS